MKLRLVLVVLGVAIVAAGCGDGSQALATVNGTDLTAEFMASLRHSSGRTLDVRSEEFRQDLSLNIIRVASVQQAAAEFGIEITDDEISARIANPPARWQQLFDELAADPDTTDVYARNQAELSIVRDRVTAELFRAEEGLLLATLMETPQELASGCVRHILLATRADANEVMARIAGGEDFVTLAAEMSLDATSGGDFVGGCPVAFSGFVETFGAAAATAPLNEVVGPVESEFGFHLLRIEERVGPPTIEELQTDPSRYLPATILSSRFTPWFNEAVRASDISVSTAAGRWSRDGVGVVAPGQ